MNRCLKATACFTLFVLASACSLKSDGSGDAGVDSGLRACSEPSDCIVVPAGCCGSCGAPTRGDAIAIARDQGATYRDRVCIGVGCPACAPLFIDPTLVATCNAGQCEVIDWTAHTGSECTSNTDCAVRTPDCCPCGGDTDPGRLIGVASENAYAALVCDSDQACPECAAIYPSEVTARCHPLGHCETLDARLP